MDRGDDDVQPVLRVQTCAQENLQKETRGRLIARIKRYNGQKQKGSVEEIYETALADDGYIIRLNRGGTMKVHLNFINREERLQLAEGVTKQPDFFKEYKIQGGKEPRTNLIIHKKATTDRNILQPGYKYRSTTMKGYPISLFSGMEELWDKAAKLSRVDEWRIGANVVLYRDGSDSIGFHADNDQGEEKILSKLCAPMPNLTWLFIDRI
jgi:alkylated DNA repair dioxygenase AlkB